MCGPKLSLCCMLISIWGVIQLTIMGVLYYVHSVGLFDDLGLEGEEFDDIKEFYTRVDNEYEHAAYNCWIAACLHFITLAFCSSKFYEAARDAMIQDNDD